MKTTSDSKLITVDLFCGAIGHEQTKLHAVLTVFAVLAGRPISTSSGIEQFNKPLLQQLWIALQGIFGVVLDIEGSPSEAYPHIEDLRIKDVLLAGTTLRLIAASIGMRDECDAAMDPVYTAAFALERGRKLRNQSGELAA